MELTDLKIFIAVAENGSISRAAAALQMAQPSVSQRVANLESEVGQLLFERHRRGMRLTAAGQVMLAHATRSLDVLADGLETIRRTQTAGLHIRLSGPSSVNSFVLTPLVHTLIEAGHSVHLHDAHSFEVLQSVLDGTTDVGFILSERPIPPGIRARVVWRDEIVAVAAPQHPLAQFAGAGTETGTATESDAATNADGSLDAGAPYAEAMPIPLYALADYTLVQYRFSSEVERFWQTLTTQLGQPEQPVVSATPVEAVKSLLEMGQYVGFLPQSTVRADIAQGRLVRLNVHDLPEAAWRVAVVVRDRKYMTPAATAVMEALPLKS